MSLCSPYLRGIVEATLQAAQPRGSTWSYFSRPSEGQWRGSATHEGAALLAELATLGVPSVLEQATKLHSDVNSDFGTRQRYDDLSIRHNLSSGRTCQVWSRHAFESVGLLAYAFDDPQVAIFGGRQIFDEVRGLTPRVGLHEMIQTPEDHFQRDAVAGYQQFFGHRVAQVDQHGKEEPGAPDLEQHAIRRTGPQIGQVQQPFDDSGLGRFVRRT